MIQIENFEHPQLKVPHWRISAGDSWCVVGRNGSGKQLIDQLLIEELPNCGASSALQRTVTNKQIALISLNISKKSLKKR